MKRLLIVLLMLSQTGCGTLLSQALQPNSPPCGGKYVPSIYGGTRIDGLAIAVIGGLSFVDLPKSAILLPLAPLPLVDLPFSLAFDTILLPLSATQHFNKKRHCFTPLKMNTP